MNYTTNYSLNLPTANDSVDVSKLSENFSKIDTQLKANENAINNASVTVDQTYSSTSTNAQSGQAVAEAIAGVKVTTDSTVTAGSENPVSGGAVKNYVDGEVSSIEMVVDEISNKFEQTVNLYNDSRNSSCIINSSGVVVQQSGYFTTDPILLETGTYTVTYNADKPKFTYMGKYKLDNKDEPLTNTRYSVTSGTIVIDQPCCVRFSGTSGNAPEKTMMLVKGTTLPAEYVPYKKPTIKAEYIPVDEDVTNMKIIVDEVSALFNKSINLYNVNTNTKGIRIDPPNGTITEIVTFSTSDYIFLKGGKTYYITGFDNLAGGVEQKFSYVSIYDLDKKFKERQAFTLGEYTATENCFVRFSGEHRRNTHIVISMDEPATEYIQYKIVVKDEHIPNVSGAKIFNESLGTNKTDFIKINSNLVNHRTITGGYYLPQGGTEKTVDEMKVANSIYGYTDKIYLKPNTEYTCKDIFRIHLFDVNTDIAKVEYSRGGDYNKSYTFTTPEYETYARLSVYIGGNNSFEWQLNEGNILLEYEKQQMSICGYNFINETDNVGGLSNIKKWNKVVIDKSIPFSLNNDIEDYEKKTSTADMIALYDNLMLLHPEYITKTTETVTTSNGTQTFVRYDFVEPNLDENGKKHFEQNKVKIILSSGTHPEWSGIYGLFYAMREITNNPDLINIKRNCHFVIIPVLNPYGVDNGDRRNANKVDIARNFEVEWYSQSPTNNDGTENGSYGGTAPFTEPESVYLDTVLKENKDAIFYASCHSFQQGAVGGATKPSLFTWCASATNYVENIGGKVVDKISRLWRNKYGDDTTNKSTTLLGTSDWGAPGGSEGQQAIKYGIQGCTFEVCDWWRFGGISENMTSFVVSRACEVYVNLIGTVVDCFDYLDKKLL